MPRKTPEERLAEETAALDAEIENSAKTDRTERREGRYVARGGCLYAEKHTRDGEEEVCLAKFDATITKQRVRDDGAREETSFVISACTPRRPLREVEVRAKEFASMAWTFEAWGSDAVLMAGQGTREGARCAIQLLSGDPPSEHVYEHVGWREIGGRPVYLHAGGGLHADGVDASLAVDLSRKDPSGRLAQFHLPAPPAARALKSSVRKALELVRIAADRPLGYVLLAAVARAPVPGVYPIDFTVHIEGQTGTRKTEAAAIAQAFFGPFTARTLAGSWDDTHTMITMKTHAAKDALLVVDDFKPRGSQVDIARAHADADRVIRAAGNQSGRARAGGDMTAHPVYHPRGMILSTGEEIPLGHSCRSRMLVYELGHQEIDLDALTRLQGAARSGALSSAMSGYIQWLARHADELPERASEDLAIARQRMLGFSHARGTGIYASLWFGLRLWLDWAVELGAITADQADAHRQAGALALKNALDAQAALHADADEVLVFLSSLGAAFASGRAHVVDAEHQGPPVSMPHTLGWRSMGEDLDGHTQWRADGARVGWIGQDESGVPLLYLIASEAFAVVSKLMRDQGQTMTSTARTIYQRLRERGYLALPANEPSKSYVVRRRIAGKRQWVVPFPLKCIDVSSTESGHSGQSGQNEINE